MEDGQLILILYVDGRLTFIAVVYAIVVRTSEYDLSQEKLDNLIALSMNNAHADSQGRRSKAETSYIGKEVDGYDSS